MIADNLSMQLRWQNGLCNLPAHTSQRPINHTPFCGTIRNNHHDKGQSVLVKTAAVFSNWSARFPTPITMILQSVLVYKWEKCWIPLHWMLWKTVPLSLLATSTLDQYRNLTSGLYIPYGGFLWGNIFMVFGRFWKNSTQKWGNLQ